MSTKREPVTAADVLVMALSPVLIMSLVGSLVFFLAEVFYAGRYEFRLLYTLFLFVAGIVLVNRVAVVVDRARAWVYGGLLGVVTFIALRVWVEYPADSPAAAFTDVSNISLIGVVWWSSNRLVWDCTYIDENRPGSGKGLLAAAGWEKQPGVRPDVVEDIAEDERGYTPGWQGWYERFDQWQKARKKKPHTPGLTVVYFSLAALPIFGLGQALIPADDDERRGFAFRLAAVYVGSGLGLLLTTSFLGLRRYLRQRKLKMPVAMTATWMGLGAVLIVAFLVVGALLPRPYSETPIWNPTRAMTQDRSASPNSVNRDSGGKGEGRAGDEAAKADGKATGKGCEPGGKGKSGEAKSGSGDKQGKTGSGDDKSGRNSGEKGEQAKGEQDQSKEGSESNREASETKKEGAKSSSNAAERFQNSSIGNALSRVAGVLKWLVFGVLAVIVVFVIFRHGLQFLSNFMPWAKNLLAAIDAWLKGLWGTKEGGVKEVAVSAPVAVDARVPFAAFSNPFAEGTADGRSPEELVRYSFEALEAWAGDRDRERRADETPVEFAGRLGADFTWLRDDAQQLAGLVARLVYADGTLPKDARDSLDRFWDRLTTGAIGEVDEEVDEEVEIVEE